MDNLLTHQSILITGIQGFVGRNLVESLKHEYRIYGLDIRRDRIDGVVEIFLWDELDRLPDVYAVIHLAGIAHDLKQQSKWDIYFKVNTGLTRIIYDWYRDHAVNKFFFFSSIKAAADSAGDRELAETVVPRPVGPYGESKLAAEEYIISNPVFPSQSFEKSTYILRPAMIHGPGNKGNLNLLYKLVKSGIPWPLGTFHNQRSFCSIDNVVFLLRQLLNGSAESGVYHLSDDEKLSTNELVVLIAQALGRRSNVWSVPAAMVNASAQVGTFLHLPFNEERLKKLTENYMVSNEKVKKALKVDKLPVTARDGIYKTIKSFTK
jgi:nucleoside-diphosphate-sugar epimerase